MTDQPAPAPDRREGLTPELLAEIGGSFVDEDPIEVRRVLLKDGQIIVVVGPFAAASTPQADPFDVRPDDDDDAIATIAADRAIQSADSDEGHAHPGWPKHTHAAASTPQAVDGLDAAWAEAEAALFATAPRDEAVIEGVSWEKRKDGAPDERFPDRYHARAYRWDTARPWHRVYADGLTAPAALRALAARLTEKQP